MSSSSKLRFEEILKLIEYIPITVSFPSNGRFAKNITIDSMFYFESLQRNGNFRDIVRIINTELDKIGSQQNRLQREKQKTTFLDVEQRYKQLHEIGCSYPIEYLLFDFCLSVLEEHFHDPSIIPSTLISYSWSFQIIQSFAICYS